MRKAIHWIAMALFPNSGLANRPVKVSRKEYLALQREIAESSKYSMGETVKPEMFYKDGNLRPSGNSKVWNPVLHDSVQMLNYGKRLDGSDIEDYPRDGRDS
ncbi:MAG: hypothetical protein RIR29_599 [Actinomycetota bacterium]|jgi:hypothetical protein